MSHFTIVVLLPGDTPLDSLKARASALLAPFSEELAVEPHEVDCYCKGRIAIRAGQDQVQAESPMAAMRELFEKERPHAGVNFGDLTEAQQDEVELAWEQQIAARKAREAEAAKAHPLFEVPDAECSECGGTGRETTTRNPQGYWDWWRIGGRWDGWLTDAPQVDDGRGGFNFGEEFTKPERNAISVEKLGVDKIPYAIVDAEGRWHAKGKMGWWGCDTKDRTAAPWPERAAEIYAANLDKLAVCVDAHV